MTPVEGEYMWGDDGDGDDQDDGDGDDGDGDDGDDDDDDDGYIHPIVDWPHHCHLVSPTQLSQLVKLVGEWLVPWLTYGQKNQLTFRQKKIL